MARPKNAGKRKRVIKAEDVEKFASLGLTVEQVAGNLGIHAATLYDRFKEEPHIRDAFDIGRSKAIALVANKLFSKAMEGDNVSIIFWLKAVGKWRDTNHIELTGANDGPVQIEDMRSKVLLELEKLGSANGSTENKEKPAGDESSGSEEAT